MAEFSDMLGQVIVEIDDCEKGSTRVRFHLASGAVYDMYHDQDCCESVELEDIAGDVEDLIGHTLVECELATNSDSHPEGWTFEGGSGLDSYTWSFYKLRTVKGSVTLRWLGESNGYYSEEVSFEQVEGPDNG